MATGSRSRSCCFTKWSGKRDLEGEKREEEGLARPRLPRPIKFVDYVEDFWHFINHQGRIQTEVEGGATWRGGAKNTIESEWAEGPQKFFGRYSRKFSGFSTE